ncbi:uncharacterized protein LOC100206000 isoform X3 [Hydra vulgaris]|uniref:Uncharacterized protein LOC100206000 isoform X3 n=1 Tax=Hydra vulgaris TaxID=6087 RepID=A0ABM4D9Y9_HYDVU
MSLNILLGCTGSVAAIKVPELIECLKKKWNNANIKLVLTKNSEFFLTKVLERTTSKVEWYKDVDEWKDWKHIGDPILHINLSKWADIFLICPLDANTMAKLATGLCDNLLTCICRAWDFKKPIIVAPAMNTLMWQNPLSSQQVALLTQLGYFFIYPIAKLLACGDTVLFLGIGAMEEVTLIVEFVYQHIQKFDIVIH